jgi:hypothetical protein
MSYRSRPVCFCKIHALLILVALERVHEAKDRPMEVSDKQRKVRNATCEMGHV